MAALNTDSQIHIFKTHIIIYLNLSNIRNNLINKLVIVNFVAYVFYIKGALLPQPR